jgi:hypothetical protein
MFSLARAFRFLLVPALLSSSAGLAQPAERISGEVKEKIDASVYTYLRLAMADGEVWAAVPTATVQVGEKVTLDVQSVMPKFESKTLHRTFERLAFATLVTGSTPPPAAAAPTRRDASKPRPFAELLTPRSSAKPVQAANSDGSGLEGVVLEVLEVPSYTYLRLKTAEGEQWAAVTTAPAKLGDKVRVANPMVMANFESKALKRVFERIVFGTLAH